MHSAPSVNYPVGRSRFAGVAMGVIWLIGVCAVLAWWSQAQSPAWRALIASLLVAGTGIAAATSWWRSPSGQLAWDGDSWTFASAGPRRGSASCPEEAGAITVSLDLQRVLLISWQSPGATYWIWLERRTKPERWDDVRRAVYSRARSQAPSAATP